MRITFSQSSLVSMHQRPGPEQVTLSVKIRIPGNWFPGHSNLTEEEQAEFYWCTAVEFEEKHLFEPAKARQSAKYGPAIRFINKEDVEEDQNNAGFWIRLEQWNRYRHDTYKDDREAEEIYMPNAPLIELDQALQETALETAAGTPLVYSYFNFLRTGTHIQNEGKANARGVTCDWYLCKNKEKGCCKGREDTCKVVMKGTTVLLRHVKLCFGDAAWMKCRLHSANSKLRQGAPSLHTPILHKQQLIHININMHAHAHDCVTALN